MSTVDKSTTASASILHETVKENRFVTPLSLLTTIMIFMSFWYVEHSWDASEFAYLSQESYTGEANLTADRLSQVNPASAIFRLAIAGWGCLCFLLAPKFQIRLSSPLLWGLVTVGLFLMFSVLWSINTSHTIFKLAVFGSMVVAALGIASALSIREILTTATIVCLSFIGIGIVSEIAFGNFRILGDYRFIGTTHPNTEAIYASIICLTARMFLSSSGKLNYIAIVFFFFGMIMVWLTKSRTTLAGLLLSLLIIQAISLRGSNRILMISTLVVMLSLGLAGFTLISQSSSGTLGSVATMGRKDDVSTLSGRLPLWEELVDSISKRPLIGHGYLAYWDAKRVEYLSETFRWEIPHGHNLYLDTMLDIGILGLVVVIFTIFAAMYQALVLYWKTNRIEYSITFGLFIYAMSNGFAESIFKLPNFPLFLVLTCSFSMLFERLPLPVGNAVREALSHPSRIRRGNESEALQSESRSQIRPYPKPIKRPNLR